MAVTTAPALRTGHTPEGFRKRVRDAGLKTEVVILREGESWTSPETSKPRDSRPSRTTFYTESTMNLRTRSQAMQQRAERFFPGGVNSPVRAFGAVGGTPPFMERAEGAWLIDADGNQIGRASCRERV